MKIALLIAFVLCASVSAQFIPRFIIDDFGNGIGDRVEVELENEIDDYDADLIVTDSFNFGSSCSGTVGCARDMEIRVSKGLAGRDFSSRILSSNDERFAGNWVVANPKTSTGFVSIEYDGPDSEFDDLFSPDLSLSLDGAGAAGVDITANGNGRELQFICITDLLTTFTIVMYDTNGAECSWQLVITPVDNDYTDEETLYNVALSAASPNSCDQTRIAYIQTFVTNDDAVDLIVRRIQVIGVPDPSPSRTPSPTRTPSPAPSASNTPSRPPSASNTPSRTPSPTRTPSPAASASNSPSRTRTPSSIPSNSPSRTPSPSGPCIIFCTCPSFTCQIAFDIDDNVNTLSPGFTSYFFFDDDDDVVITYRDDDNNPDDDQIIYVDFDDDENDDDFAPGTDDDDISVSINDDITVSIDDDFSVSVDDDFSVSVGDDDDDNDDDDDSASANDDDDDSASANDDDDDSASGSSSSANDDDDDNNGSSSSSSASVVVASIALLAVALF